MGYSGRSSGRRSNEPSGPPEGPDADPVEFAREIALRQLTARARSRAELESALRKRRVPDDVATQVLDRLGEVGLIDDAEFARLWVEGQQRRLRSTSALRRELREKGVDDEVIAEAVADAPDDADAEVALELARRKLRAGRNLDREVARRRALGALARRGFSSGASFRAVEAALAESDAAPAD